MPGGDLAHLGLGQIREREAEAGQQRRRERGEHVALVLGRVGRGGEQRPGAVVDDAGVVAGDEARGAEPLGEVAIAAIRTSPLQRTQGLGVRPAA